jgi:hypothetical protein
VEDFLDSLTDGHVTAVKVVLASVAAALAGYQLVLIAVAYGKLRPGFLSNNPASSAHRAVGDTTAVILLIVAAMCISYFGFEAEDHHGDGSATLHMITGSALVIVLALKIVVVRWWHGLGKYLPLLGGTVFVLLGVTGITSAGAVLT